MVVIFRVLGGMSTEEPQTPETIEILGIEIPPDQQTPLVMALLAVIQKQQKEIEELKDEVQRLKGTTRKPEIKPSRLLKDTDAKNNKAKRKRPGSAKRHKTKRLAIDETVILKPDRLPDGARLEGYRDFVVQDLVIRPHNTRYRRAVYRLPDGSLRVAERPDNLTCSLRPRASAIHLDASPSKPRHPESPARRTSRIGDRYLRRPNLRHLARRTRRVSRRKRRTATGRPGNQRLPSL